MQQLWRINMATTKCVETTSESHVHFAKHSSGEMKTRPSIAQYITTTRNQIAAMNCHTYIAPLTMEWRLVSCLWRLRLPTPIGLLCQLECRSHHAHRCMFPHFRPPVTLSTVSWFCCRSQCRLVSSWHRVSRLPLELRRPFLKVCKNCRRHLVRLFQLVTKASHHFCTAQAPHRWLCTFTQGSQTGFQSSWWDTHALEIWQFHCQITLKTVCYQPYWKASVWMLLCNLHRIILQ